jgi:uncharacterized protein (DUF1015 family)
LGKRILRRCLITAISGAQMVIFKPFKGLIPSLDPEEDISQRISPPYDVIDDHELEELRADPFNVTRITLNSQEGRYLQAAKEMMGWISSGKLKQDEEACFYLYQQSFLNDGRRLTRTGLVGVLSLEPYDNRMVIPHEETISKVKEDRLRLLEDTETHSESIFGLYHHSEIPIEELLSSSEKLFETEDHDAVIHSFHRISDPEMVSRIQSMMMSRTVLIADGHHRYETALKYSQEHEGEEEKSFVLTTLVSSDDQGMILLPTHRLLSDLDMEEEELLERMRERLIVESMDDFPSLRSRVAEKEHMGFGLITRSKRMYYAFLEELPTESVLWAIDAYACQEIIFKSVLGDKIFNIEYEESCKEARNKVMRGRSDLAILLGSPKLDEIWKIAGEGIKMPKKSTFFYPKIWSGFVYYSMSR